MEKILSKNLPYFLVIAALIFLIIAVLSSGEKKPQLSASIEGTAERFAEETWENKDIFEEDLFEEDIFEDDIFEQEISAQDVFVQAVPELEEIVFEEPEKINFAGRNTAIAAIPKGGTVLFGFEANSPIWEIPDWCFEKRDYVGETVACSARFSREKASSLELMANFPGARWTSAYIEVQEYFDWMAYQALSAELFLPADAPMGLTARFILTVGEDWKWTEMSRATKLVPGEWNTITASIVPGSTDWRRTQVTDEFRADVRKLGIRIESNMRPAYDGPIYIDYVRLK